MRRLTLDTRDHLDLALTHFAPEGGEARGAVIVLGATGAVQERYADFARFLARDGWHAVTFDYRGMGRSAGATGGPLPDWTPVSMQAWAERDLAAVVDWSADTLAPRRLVAVGHSIGGQIVPLAPNAQRLDAVLGVAAQKGYWPLWPAPQRYLVWGFFRLYIPACLRLFGRVPLGWAGLADLPREVARDYARWTLRLDYASAEGEDLTGRMAAFSAPYLSLSLADDIEYAPRAAVDFLMRQYYRSAPVWRGHLAPRDYGVAGLGHSGFFETRCPKALWHDASRWLAAAADGRADGFRFEALRGVSRLSDVDAPQPPPDLEPGSAALPLRQEAA